MATKEPQDGKQADSQATAASSESATAENYLFGQKPIEVTLRARPPVDTEHAELNSLIRFQIESTSFKKYQAFMDKLVGPPTPSDGKVGATMVRAVQEQLGLDPSISETALVNSVVGSKRPFPIHGTVPYELLRVATEVWLLTRNGAICRGKATEDEQEDIHEFTERDAVRHGTSAQKLRTRLYQYIKTYISPENSAATPYLDIIVDQLLPTIPPPDKLGYAYRSRWECPSMIELIWSYWHEEGMQCQTMNAIALRFQNRKSRPGRDPLVNLAIDPLRPLQNLLWGWVESSYKRLTIERRAYEYVHSYDCELLGKAIPRLMPADRRSTFLEGFHNLLHLAHQYYMERADTTRIPDGFALLNALRNLHIILAEGAHNQYGDLPWTSRVEMLIEQWLLARPEMREFLRGRAMVPYQEPWMGQVDTMKKLQGWSDVNITHFHELATTGEALLLSVRHGPWATTNDQAEATTWASYWEDAVRRYMHAYEVATGVNLSTKPVNSVMPSRLLQARIKKQRAAMGSR